MKGFQVSNLKLATLVVSRSSRRDSGSMESDPIDPDPVDSIYFSVNPKRISHVDWVKSHGALWLLMLLALTGCAATSDDGYILADGQAIKRHPLKQTYPRREPVNNLKLAYVKPEVKKVLLPYVEAEGIAENWAIFWLSDDEVAFTTRKPNTFHLTEAERSEIRGGNLPDYFRDDRARWFEMHILDTRTGITRKHADGTLVSYKNGIATIILEHYSKRHPASGEPIESREFDKMLVGTLGKEQPVTQAAEPARKLLNKCPGEPLDSPKGMRKMLKLEHGCLKSTLAPYETAPGQKTIYYKADGSSMELPLTAREIPDPPLWIDWLGAYQMHSVHKSYNEIQKLQARKEVTMYTINFLKPDGRLLLEPVKVLPGNVETDFPTRAGMIKFYSSERTPTDDGLHLHRGAEILQLTEGDVYRKLSVSPNGCKVAFPSALRGGITLGLSYEDYRLSVIDVCKAFKLSTNDIPFSW